MHALAITIPMAYISNISFQKVKLDMKLNYLPGTVVKILPGYFFDVNKKEKEVLQVKYFQKFPDTTSLIGMLQCVCLAHAVEYHMKADNLKITSDQ